MLVARAWVCRENSVLILYSSRKLKQFFPIICGVCISHAVVRPAVPIILLKECQYTTTLYCTKMLPFTSFVFYKLYIGHILNTSHYASSPESASVASPVHNFFCRVLLQALYGSPLTSTTPNNNQEVEQLFSLFVQVVKPRYMSSMVVSFVCAICKCL